MILNVNMRSIANPHNFSKLEALLESLKFKPTVIAITEKWIQCNQTGHYFNLKDYVFISNSRITSRGGGVGFYVKSGIDFQIIQPATIMKEKNI